LSREGREDGEVRRTDIVVENALPPFKSSVRSDIIRNSKRTMPLLTELEPMRMINYKDAAPTALENVGDDVRSGLAPILWTVCECMRHGYF
jgi:hypothetical protein